jgi:hypothetical protein
MLNKLNDSPDSFEKAIAKICIIFVILAAINLFSGFLQVHCVRQVHLYSFASLCCIFLGMVLVCSRGETDPKVSREVCQGNSLSRDRMVRLLWCRRALNPSC